MSGKNVRHLREVEEVCRLRSETDRKGEAAKDKNSNLDFFAIRVPILRQIAKTGFSFSARRPEKRLEIWSQIYMTSGYYEPMALALYTGLSGGFPVTTMRLDYLTLWAQRVENWGHCDLLGNNIANFARGDWKPVKNVLQDWSECESTWLQRLSLVSLVSYVGKNAVFLEWDEVAPFLRKHWSTPDPYVANAVGWVLREYLKSETQGRNAFVFTHMHRASLSMRAQSKLTKAQKLEICQ